jgi:hypothetical protein
LLSTILSLVVNTSRSRCDGANVIASCCVAQFPIPNLSVHADAVEILVHAVERSASGDDKEAVAKLWSGFLRQFFRLPSPAGTAGTVAVRDIVSTPYGVGVVEGVRPPSSQQPGGVIEVLLSWGTCFLAPTGVTPYDTAPPDSVAVTPAGGTGRVKPLVSLPKVVPVPDCSDVPTTRDLPPSVCYCASNGFLFFRLYHILTVRLRCVHVRLCACVCVVVLSVVVVVARVHLSVKSP